MSQTAGPVSKRWLRPPLTLVVVLLCLAVSAGQTGRQTVADTVCSTPDASSTATADRRCQTPSVRSVHVDAVGVPLARWAAPSAPVAPAQTRGMEITGTTTYRVDVDAGLIAVHVDVTVKNTRPPDGYYFYYFTHFGVPAVGPVTNVRAHIGEDIPLGTHTEDGELGLTHIVVDLPNRLNYAETRQIDIRYDLPAQPNGSESPTRINDAFASWWVISTGDDGAGRVVIDVPDRFDVEVGSGLEPGTESVDDRQVLEFNDFDEFDGIFGVTAHDNDRLLSRTVEVAGTEFTIRAWPGDEEWGDFAADAVLRGIPALADFIGVDIDEDRDLEIIETATPYIYGYAGWYDRIGGFIEVGDERDLNVILHELSHIWFHSQLFSDRWLLEGLAEVASNRVIDSLGGNPEPVPAIDFGAPGAVPLSQWGAVSVLDDDPVSELWGYATSYAVMDRIVDTIGEDTLRAVLARAAERELPLKVDDGADEVRRVRDWRYFYDLIDVETDTSEVRAILIEYVITDEDAATFGPRDEAMASYHRLVDDSDGWAPPFAVRDPLGRWTFSNATNAMDAAEDVLALRDELDELIDPAHGLSLEGLRDAYQGAQRMGDLNDITDAHDDYVAAARAIGDVEDRVNGANPLRRFGLWNRTADDRDAARAAFGVGDFGEVADRLARVESALDDATVIGLLRAVPTAGIAGLWTALIMLVVRRRTGAGAPA